MKESDSSRKLFNRIDIDGDGYIDFDDYLHSFLTITQGQGASSSELIKLFFQSFEIQQEKCEYTFSSLYTQLRQQQLARFPPHFTSLIYKKYRQSIGEEIVELYSEQS
jgi:hypothetical protein